MKKQLCIYTDILQVCSITSTCGVIVGVKTDLQNKNKAGEVDCHGPETEVVETWGLVFHGVRLLGKSDQKT